MSVATREVLEAASSISSFGIEMTHMSEQLMKFASNIAEVSESNLSTIKETNATMNEVTDTIDVFADTLDILKNESEISSVVQINESMQEVKTSTVVINKTMETSSSDAQRLSGMSQNIHHGAIQSVDYAKNILKIDDKISAIVTDLGFSYIDQ